MAEERTQRFDVLPIFALRFGNDSFKPHLAAAQSTGKTASYCHCRESRSTLIVRMICSNWYWRTGMGMRSVWHVSGI